MENELTSEIVLPKILAAKSDSEVLQIAGATNNKKAFKKLSLLVHPDKCTDERANEAFRRVKGAFENLKKRVDPKISSSSASQPKEDPWWGWDSDARYSPPPPTFHRQEKQRGKQNEYKPGARKYKASNSQQNKKGPKMKGGYF